MISGLIDELNKSADEWNGSNMFELARMCREAADTICELQTENAKLRDGANAMRQLYEDELKHALAENAKLRESVKRLMTQRDERLARAETDNAKLREQLERLQPKDCEGNVLDIADTVNMLRSEYDGDHEWEDVVTELVLTKWGGDRWIVRGSKGEAWACDCTKTGYDEDAYEASDDVEPFGEPTLLEVENAKLRNDADLLRAMLSQDRTEKRCYMAENAKLRELCAGLLTGYECGNGELCDGCSWNGLEGDCAARTKARELGVEVDG